MSPVEGLGAFNLRRMSVTDLSGLCVLGAGSVMVKGLSSVLGSGFLVFGIDAAL